MLKQTLNTNNNPAPVTNSNAKKPNKVNSKAIAKTSTNKKAKTSKVVTKANKPQKAASALKGAGRYQQIYVLGLAIAFATSKQSNSKGELVAMLDYGNNKQLGIVGLTGKVYLYTNDLTRIARLRSKGASTVNLAASTFKTVLRHSASINADILGTSGNLADILFVGTPVTNGLVCAGAVNKITGHLVKCGMHANGTTTAPGVNWPAKAPAWLAGHLNIDTSYSTISGKGKSKQWVLDIKPVPTK
tara:strand:+ start:2085 stop:2819 length:735 start_codon:yes stop_codon:yes gene_type:complete